MDRISKIVFLTGFGLAILGLLRELYIIGTNSNTAYQVQISTVIFGIAAFCIYIESVIKTLTKND